MIPVVGQYVSALSILASLLTVNSAAAQGRPATPVTVAPVVERDIPASIRLVGTVLPERSALVAAEVAGLVAAFSASEGQYLKKEEKICRLDPQIAQARLDEAQARAKSLRAQLEELEHGTRAEILAQLDAAQGEAQAIYDMWKFERERIADLFERHQSSAKEKHDTEMEFLAAERRLAQSKAEYEAARNGPRTEEIERARYELAAQQAVVRRLARDLKKTEICAPFDGFLVSKQAEVGEWIEVGGAVGEIVAIDLVKVRTDVPESAIAFAKPGTWATVELDALGESRAAHISRVIPRAAAAARTFPVEIDLENPGHQLLPGMFVWAHVPAGPSGKRLMVHKDAIVPQGAAKRLFVIRPGRDGAQMAMPLTVETGLEQGGEIEVRSPQLRSGDQVVIRANERLHGPTPVLPQAAPAREDAEKTLAGETEASDDGTPVN